MHLIASAVETSEVENPIVEEMPAVAAVVLAVATQYPSCIYSCTSHRSYTLTWRHLNDYHSPFYIGPSGVGTVAYTTSKRPEQLNYLSRRISYVSSVYTMTPKHTVTHGTNDLLIVTQCNRTLAILRRTWSSAQCKKALRLRY